MEPVEKKKPKRSAKPKREQPENHADATIRTHPAPEAADETYPAPQSAPSPVNGSPSKPVYDWDRTPAESAQQVEDERIRKTPFPLPNAKTQPFEPFCEYWNALIKDPVSRYARLYVHRWFPSVKPKMVSDRLGIKRETYPGEKTLHSADGPLSELKLLSEVGVGDYTIRLNDTRRPFAQATILHCEKFATRRDWDHYPPLIDPDDLDWDDPANQVYIKWLKSRGGGTESRKEDESEMANAAVVSQLLEQNKHLTEHAIRKDPTPPAPAQSPANGNGDGGALKAVADLAIAVLNRPQPALAPAADPMAMVTGIAGVVQTLMPKPDTSSADLAKEVVKESAAANERVFKMQEQAIDELRKRIAEKDTAPATTPVVAPVPPTQVEILQQELQKKQLLKQLYGNPAADEESKPSSVDKWLDAAPVIAPIFGQFISGLFQTVLVGFQSWQLNHYNDACAKTGEKPKPPQTLMNNQQQPPEPGKPMPPQAPAPSPEQQAAQQQWNAIMTSAIKVVPYMLSSLESDPPETGAEFAAFIIKRADEKRVSYDKLRNLADGLKACGIQVPGESEVKRFINAAGFVFEKLPPPLNRIMAIPTVPQFLTEFYNYDEYMANLENQ